MIKRLDKTPLQRVFTLRNDSGQPITLSGLAGVERSLTVAVPEAGDHPSPMDDFFPNRPRRLRYVLPAGQTAHLNVTLVPEWLPVGPVHKTIQILVLSRDLNIRQAEPAAALEITVRILPAATLSPSTLDFGRVPSGVQKTRSLTVTLDARLLATGKPPRLVAPYPLVILQEPTLSAPQPGQNEITETYTLAVSPQAAWGLLRGSISLLPAVGVYDSPLEGATVPVQGEVVGDITASPAEIDFGTLVVGQGAAQRVTLTGARADFLEGIKLNTGAAAFLTARLLTMTGEVLASTEPGFNAVPVSGIRTAILEVTLSPQARAIGLETNIAISPARLIPPRFTAAQWRRPCSKH